MNDATLDSTERPILIFDVNETLLDIGSLEPHFERIFKSPGRMREWFNQVILYSEALTLAGEYEDFATLGGAVLQMMADIYDSSLAPADLAAIKSGMASLPPHPDTTEAIKRLHDAGFPLVTLTNNPVSVCDAQLRHAGIRQYFHSLFSIEMGGNRYKPALDSYRAVTDALGVDGSRTMLIACHTWDVLGAAAAGMRTALILREGNAPLPVGRQPDLVGADLSAIAEQLMSTSPNR